mmetsp:Transcript_12386/g.37493  ORF Transcript_12386/g.37493 Transcript_12386/m.37493 type:complete len:184 (+) Transcript_12386:179-730(+)
MSAAPRFQELPCRVHFLQMDMELGVETSSSKLMQFPSNINVMEATEVILRKFSHLDAMGSLEELSLFALAGELGAEKHEIMLAKARLFSYRHPSHSVMEVVLKARELSTVVPSNLLNKRFAGSLYMRTGARSVKKRWFVLSGALLYIFPDDKANSTAIGKIDLSAYREIAIDSANKKLKCGFK